MNYPRIPSYRIGAPLTLPVAPESPPSAARAPAGGPPLRPARPESAPSARSPGRATGRRTRPPPPPPHPAVPGTPPRRRRSGHELHEALRQQPLALPHAVVHIEHPEPRPVAAGAVVIAGEQEVPVRVRLEHLAADADLVEQRPLRKREILLTTLPYRVANEHAERERVRVPVAAEGVRLELERSRGAEPEGVECAGVDE